MVFGNKKSQMSFFNKIYLLVLIPSALFLLCILFVSISYQKTYTNFLQNAYSNEIQIFSQGIDEKLQNIIFEAKDLENNTDFKKTISNHTNDAVLADKTVSVLDNFVISRNLVHSAIILDFDTKSAITNAGRYNIDSYFKDFEEYTPDYWYNYEPIYDKSQFLTTQSWKTGDSRESVIPIVLSPWGSLSSNNLFIVNISIKEILKNLNPYVLTKNTSIFLLDKYNREIFKSDNITNEGLLNFVNSNDFLDEITKSISATHKIDGRKYLTLTSSPKKSSWNQLYITFIPYHDIYSSFPPIPTYILAFLILLCFSLFIFAYFDAKIIYKPFANIEQIINKHPKRLSSKHKNTFDYIESLLNDSLTVQSNYDEALSILKEKFLCEILLTQKTTNAISKNQETFFKNKVSFENPYFIAIAFGLEISQSSKNMFYDELFDDLSIIIKKLFSQHFDTYLIKEQKKHPFIYLILNPSEDECLDKINTAINEFLKLLEADSKYIEIHYGIGEVCTGIENAVYSYNEAKSILLNSISHSKTDGSVSGSHCEFTLNDEQLLTNYLMTGHVDKAMEFSMEFINKFSDNIPSANKNRCYTMILSVIFKVMYTKQIPYESDFEKDESDIIARTLLLSQEDFKQFILELLDLIRNHFRTNDSKLNISEIIDYINQNFATVLSLDILADKFETNSSYLSRRIKQYIGINFSDYLAQLRVNEAKNLLLTTDKSITDIFHIVGFDSRSTFLRAFKAVCGVTPSEYRNSSNH